MQVKKYRRPDRRELAWVDVDASGVGKLERKK